MAAARNRTEASKAFTLWTSALLVAAAWCAPTPATADHSIGRSCLDCHSLKSTNVVSGSRNVKKDLVEGVFFYGPDTDWGGGDTIDEAAWYCPGGNTNPRSKTDGTFVGGNPLDCSYCHQSTNDIGIEIQNASDSVASGASAHPVDTKGSTQAWGAVRITCNQCHNADVTPQDLCTKGTDTGYPNHKAPSGLDVTSLGTNQRIGTAAHLQFEYGPAAGNNWTNTTGILCFECHKSGGLSSFDVKADYDAPRGGHNVLGIGSLANKKLPCYNCHDPHGVENNQKLIIEAKLKVAAGFQNPYGTSYVSKPPPTLFNGTNDRVVCASCHNAGALTTDVLTGHTVEAVNLPNVLADAWVPSAFPFHANVHADVQGMGNCLQQNGGCHQGPHNTDVFRCLDCHSKAQADANAHPRLVDSLNAGFVGHVDSEFGHVGSVLGNGLKSYHTIVYDTAKDLAFPASDTGNNGGNGCLECHDTRGAGAGMILKGPGVAAIGRVSAPSGREDLDHYDAFCLSCHDGSGTDFGPYVAPDVAAYALSDGHGRATGSYDSGNSAADVPCLECHLYHGSTAFKLLPGDAPTGDGVGNVIKGGGGTVGTQFTIGKLTDSTQLDYTDYTVRGYAYATYPTGTAIKANEFLPASYNYPAWYLSEYVQLWSTYSDDTNLAPDADDATGTTPFGTSGAVRNYNSDNQELACGNDADPAGWGGAERVGFCNACHFYNDSNNGTDDTYGWAYTHEGIVGGTDCDGNNLDSQKNFFKDCAECHDPHGSGTKNGSSPNLYMIRGKIKHGATTTQNQVETSGNWSRVEFTAKGGTPVTQDDNSYDEDDLGAGENNTDDLCAVCHTAPGTGPGEDPTYNVDHNYRAYTGAPDHNQGDKCTGCHSHSWGEQTTNRGWIGFKQVLCGSCHGAPPTDLDPMPDNPDAVGVHGTHRNAIGYDCSQCHSGNDHNESGWGQNPGIAIPAGTVDVAFDPAMNPAGSYDSVTNTCSDLRCHNPDDPTVGITGKGATWQTVRSAPRWLDAYQTAPSEDPSGRNPGTWEIGDAAEECEACHLNSPPSNPDGGAHCAHECPDPPQKGFVCGVCHATEDPAANSYSVTHAAGSLTGPVPISFDLSRAGVPSLGGEAYDSATGVCTNIYCHGVGLGNGGTDTTPVWTDLSTGNCGTCHGVMGDASARPDPDPLKEVDSGHHQTHYGAVQGPTLPGTHGGAGCNSCHNSVDIEDGDSCVDNCHSGFTGGALGEGATAPSPTHVDGKVDFTGGVELAATTGCDSCHSQGAAGAKSEWGNAAYRAPCSDCHSAADPANSAADGSGVNAPASAYYDSTGHGNTAAYNATRHGQSGPGYPCDVCHHPEQAHISHALGDNNRLRSVPSDGLDHTSTVSEVCLDCHAVGQSMDGSLGYDASAEATVHSSAQTGNYGTSVAAANAFPAYGKSTDYAAHPGYQCEDCHDPHGTSKLAMIRPVLDGNLLGVSNPVTVSGLEWTDADLTDLDPSSAPDDGVCDACHLAGDAPHPDTGKAGNHSHGGTGDSCVGCHDHQDSFRFVMGSRWCLDGTCHGAAAQARNVDAEFDGLGGATANGLSSQHNILYGSGDPDDPADNECRKCHGLGHPNASQFLVYPDTVSGGVVEDGINPVGSHPAGMAVPRAGNRSAYQDFCLACHDGVDTAPWATAGTRFFGSIPAGQVAPSAPGDPATQQASSPWTVPAVPPKDVGAGGEFINPAPYFASDGGTSYFESNGHGTDSPGINQLSFNLTCLVPDGPGPQGCHEVHGSAHRFLVSDDLFSTGDGAINQVAEFATDLCLACHTPGLSMSTFHAWAPHTDPSGTRPLSGTANLAVGNGQSRLMPFYAGPDAAIEARIYSQGSNPPPQLGSDRIACLTCHDPHGAADHYYGNEYGETGDNNPSTRGMTRKFPVQWLGDLPGDPLCGECHAP